MIDCKFPILTTVRTPVGVLTEKSLPLLKRQIALKMTTPLFEIRLGLPFDQWDRIDLFSGGTIFKQFRECSL